MTANLKKGYFGYVATTPAGDRNFKTILEAQSYLFSLGLCRATCSQSVRRGEVEEWVPQDSPGKTGWKPSQATQHHPLGKFCANESCRQAFLTTGPETTCFDCRGVEWEVVFVPLPKG